MGVGGGIAAFKAVELVRILTKRGVDVRVAMTHAGTQFVGPITFAGLTGEPAITDLWDPEYAGEVHVELGAWADLIIVAPATANLIARAAHGMADDAVLATLACSKGKVVFAPAMHTRMWLSNATQRNVESLRAQGVAFVGPERGPLASGEVGEGRMAEPDTIADAALAHIARDGARRGQTIVVTAGPTREAIDPVRFLTNRSSGKMGYAIAREAAREGAEVILISGPTHLESPKDTTRIEVTTALEMRDAVHRYLRDADVLIMAAAVSDYRPERVTQHKRKKEASEISLKLIRNPDILAEVGQQHDKPFLVGFALETENLIANAKDKLQKKNCDLVVANHASDALEQDTNHVTLVSRDGSVTEVDTTSKATIAQEILRCVPR